MIQPLAVYYSTFLQFIVLQSLVVKVKQPKKLRPQKLSFRESKYVLLPNAQHYLIDHHSFIESFSRTNYICQFDKIVFGIRYMVYTTRGLTILEVMACQHIFVSLLFRFVEIFPQSDKIYLTNMYRFRSSFFLKFNILDLPIILGVIEILSPDFMLSHFSFCI